MVNGSRPSDLCGLNRACSSNFYIDSLFRQTPEECLVTYRPKRCEYNNKDKDNSPKTLNHKNHQVCHRNSENYDRSILMRCA